MSKLAKIILSVSVVAVLAALVGAALYFWKNQLELAGSCDCDCDGENEEDSN